MRKLRRPGLILFGWLVLAACGGGGGDGDGAMNGCIILSGNGVSDITVLITGPSNACENAYSPPILIVQVNTTVTWINNDIIQHTVTSSNGCACNPSDALPDADRELDSPLINPEGMYSHIFNFPGTYDYVCTVAGHQMRGRVIAQ